MTTFYHYDAAAQYLSLTGDWVRENAPKLVNLPLPRSHVSRIDADGVARLDGTGLWLMHRFVARFPDEACSVSLPACLTLWEDADERTASRRGRWLRTLGARAHAQLEAVLGWLGLAGRIGGLIPQLFRGLGAVYRQRLWHELFVAGPAAVPIVALLAFLIGVVVAYQGGIQLQSYGANLFIADFVGLIVLREMAPLVVAVIVAGRSGAAFASEIGAMSLNHEIDALRTLGYDPARFLLLPKVTALLVAVPLLTLLADIAAVVGSALVADAMLHVTWADFFKRFAAALDPLSLGIGVLKGALFGGLIALIGCFQGLQVSARVDEVGQRTTRAVVLSVFWVIVVDAVISVYMSLHYV